MNYLLAIDIGNTNVTCGVFDDSRLITRMKVPTDNIRTGAGFLKRLLSQFDVDKIIISSVVPQALAKLKKTFGRMSSRGPKGRSNPILILGENAAVPIKNLYRKKRQVGQDRLINAFAARMFYGAPAVVVDFGTAITFDVISRKGEYLGGLILPGIELSLSGLHERTALLPKVGLAPARRLIGKETKESMRGGILFGFGAMVDGLIGKYRKMLGKDLKVIATGGNAALMKRYTKSIRIVDFDLTLKGLSSLA
jgi:type III pantothenate kinase